MLNIKRTDGSVVKHQIGISKDKLLSRIIATGKLGITAFYIIPATEHKSAFSREQLKELLGPYGDISFFSKEATNALSIPESDAKFGFRFDLLKPISPELVM